jgi:hypothetical protein
LAIAQVSFPLCASGFIPAGNRCKQAVAMLAVLLASGCGGGGGATQAERLVHGTGYTFSAPADWNVARPAREVRVTKGLAVVSVTRFPLLRPYRPELWDSVLPELDRTAEEVAQQQNGKVTSRKTLKIAARNARSYDVSYEHEGKQLVERLGFVLQGKTEYLLLCRYERGGDTEACDRLLATFTLG